MSAALGQPAQPDQAGVAPHRRPKAGEARTEDNPAATRNGLAPSLEDLGPIYDDPRLAETLTARDVELDPRAMRVTVRGRPIPALPLKEFELLHLLMLNAGLLCRRDALITQIWGPGHDPASQTLNVHILRLRKKLRTDEHQPPYIRTVRGVGYIFDA